MNELKIRKIQGHLDDRGILYQPYAREYDLKRIYVIRNWKANIIRAFHKHNEEFKAYFVVQGTVKFIVIINDKPQVFILSDKELSVLEIPPKYLHGIEAFFSRYGMDKNKIAEKVEKYRKVYIEGK